MRCVKTQSHSEKIAPCEWVFKDASFDKTSTTFILYGLATFEACFLYRMTFFIHRSRWKPLICEETVETFLINSSGHEIQFRRSQLLSDLQVQIVGAARDLHFIQCSSRGPRNIKLHIGHDLAIGHDLSSVGSLTIENCIFQDKLFFTYVQTFFYVYSFHRLNFLPVCTS